MEHEESPGSSIQSENGEFPRCEDTYDSILQLRKDSIVSIALPPMSSRFHFDYDRPAQSIDCGAAYKSTRTCILYYHCCYYKHWIGPAQPMTIPERPVLSSR